MEQSVVVRVCRSMPGLFNRGHLSRSMGDHRFFLASGDGSRSMEQRRHGNDFAQDVTRSWPRRSFIEISLQVSALQNSTDL